jgi:DNA-binding Lrp family transcriptional regulator
VLKLDRIDVSLLRELSSDGRASHVVLSERVGLSSTACARRVKALEDAGLIEGYEAKLNLARFGLGITVLVMITLESQSEDALACFEEAIVRCSSVVRCFLMSGSDDYLVTVLARDIADFERVHQTQLSRLPRVARIQSSFAIREVINRGAPPVVFERALIRS